MANLAPTARSEWRAHWPMVMAALIGGSFSAVSVQSMSLFIDPLHDAFSWSRTQITIGLTLFAFITTPLAPFAGALIDRYGPRRIALLGLFLATLIFASFGLTTGSIPVWIAQWSAYAVAAVGLKITVWTAAVSRAFDRARGMALAVTLSGTALSQTIAPLAAYWLIQTAGWRNAYFALAFGWGGLALVLAALFFRTDGVSKLAKRDNTPEPPLSIEPGLTIAEAVRSVRLYRIALALTIGTILATAIVTHKISILNEMGMSRWVAAQVAATAGIAGICGKLLGGWLCDRTDSRLLGGGSFGITTIGFVLLLEPLRSPTLVVIAMVLLGLGAGASLQAVVYMTSRYAGLRNFGKIFGTVGSATVVGVGLGPLLGSQIVDRFGSYEPLLLLGLPLSLLSALLMTGLGPYPDWSRRGDDSRSPA